MIPATAKHEAKNPSVKTLIFRHCFKYLPFCANLEQKILIKKEVQNYGIQK